MAPKLSPNLERLWARGAGPEREPRRGLNVERIVQAAIELADADGLAAVSMSRVADRLGFTTMSLYRHVSSKDELLMLMMDKVATPTEALDEPIEGWRPALERWCHELRGAMRRHPWFLEIPVGPRLTPGPLAWLDRGLQALEGTRLTENEKANLILLLNGLVFWEARLDVELADAAQQPPGGFGALLSPLVDAERFPALRRAMDAGIFDDDQDRDDDFAFDLARVLDGIERLVKERE